MAEKRMFSLKIIDSDAFLDMPLSAQALYVHLSMQADDDGFINNPKKVQRGIGASADDLKLLVAKRFILMFENGVVAIKHWRINNTLRKDRYTPTQYQEEFDSLSIKDNGAYTEKVCEICENEETLVDQSETIGKPNGNHLATKRQPLGNQTATNGIPNDNQTATKKEDDTEPLCVEEDEIQIDDTAETPINTAWQPNGNHLATNGIPLGNQTATQNRIEKDRVDKIKTAENKNSILFNSRQPAAVKEIVALFNSICKSYPEVKTLSAANMQVLQERLEKYTLDDFKTLFEKTEASEFLKGGNERKWTAKFGWLIEDENMAKVLNGNYDKFEHHAGTGTGSSGKNSGSKFNNFPQADYDFDALERQLNSMQTAASS